MEGQKDAAKAPVKLIQVSPSKIPGRGGSSLIHVTTTEKQH